jgi:hypothetical protein
MACKRDVAAGLVIAFFGCNRVPPVPDNPLSPEAPDLGPTTLQPIPPPPVSGGTLLLSRDGKTAIASDPDRDFVSFVDVSSALVRAQPALSLHDEPGRLVEDSAGQVHVALRGSGELATFSLATGQLVGRRAVCAQPRGVAYDATNDQVLVACATGELVTLPAASGPAVQTVMIEPGLRDVVIDGDTIFVSKFRTAEILALTRSGTITQRASPPGGSSAPSLPPTPPGGQGLPSAASFPGGASVALAWRMRLTSDHQLMVSYQVDSVAFVPTTPGGYGGSAQDPVQSPTIVQTAIASMSTTDMTTAAVAVPPNEIVLPVDVAVPPSGIASGGTAVVVAAANWKSQATTPYAGLGVNGGPSFAATAAPVEGQLIAAEIGTDGTIFLQSREPARLYRVQPNATGQGADAILSAIVLSDVSREDTGHTIFHTNSGGSLACASCHGEGGDDAQTWNFDGTKPRRTPSLLGTVKGTAPYHWDADFPDLSSLFHEIYTMRMSGRVLAADQQAALKGWLEQLPGPKRPAGDPAALARGQALFAGKGSCSTCHSGPSYTNNATMDVGTGAPFQVPPLIGVGARSPFLHAGCAATLTDRFTTCATAAHGTTSNLTTAEIGDLVAFLNSL